MFRLKIIFVSAGMLLLAGCATPGEVSDVVRIQETKAEGGTPFTKALTDEYRAAAKHESEVEYEWSHAAIFARKGLKTAKGGVVPPEKISAWEIPESRVGELTDARKRLMAYLANGASERVPEAAAKAQVMFDCWIEEEAEGDSKSNCRAVFLATEPKLKILKVAAPPPKPAPKPKPMPEALPPLPAPFIVYFAFDKSDLDAKAMAVIKEAAEARGTTKATKVMITGHTDLAGDKGYNVGLSLARVVAVGNALVKEGVARSLLVDSWLGEEKPRVSTADGQREAENRRVEITLKR